MCTQKEAVVTSTMPELSLNRRRIALLALFFVPGIAMASWVTRTPSIRDALGVSTAEMGFVLFGLSIGSMLGILSSGPLVTRWGARPIIFTGTLGVVLSMPIVGVGTALAQPLLVAAGLLVFGAGMGTGEVAMNVEGAEYEATSARTFLPAMHGFFSLGTVVAAILGIVATALAFPVPIHLTLIGIIAAIILALSMKHIPHGTGRVTPGRNPSNEADTAAEAGAESSGLAGSGPRGSTRKSAPVWRDPRLLIIGVVVLGMALAEGTANDWLPLLMVDGHGFDPALGSSVYAIFAASMTIGRLLGGRIVARFGRTKVLFTSGVFGLIGIGLISFVDNQIIAATAVILWGLGTSLGFPVALSTAGDSGPHPAKRVATVSTIGYLAFLAGPPALGILGEEVGLRGALVIPMSVIVIVIAVIPLIRSSKTTRVHTPRSTVEV